MKKGLIIIAILLAALAAWIVAFPKNNPILKAFGQKTPVPNQGQPDIPTSAVTGSRFNIPEPPKQDDYGFPLTIGSRGDYVRTLQSGLNDNFGTDLVIDGIFGQKTYNAVSAHGFNADAVSRTEYLKIINGYA